MNITKYIEKSLDYIGYTGPIITFAITSVYLLFISKYVYLIFFCGGFWINILLNHELKNWIREPRPNKPIPYIDNSFEGAHIYGMPSGHAQMCLYNIGFLFFVSSNNWILAISILISILTLFQRWKFRRHTIKQLCVGSLIGFGLSFAVYYLLLNF
uniref:Phosphatidic acid phosphatase type 2/haloperoxidase domain-containing protein n=1 Tax=viral metagenome TaxID=1070528 RepID=A0A6C0I085_9ZZZZ